MGKVSWLQQVVHERETHPHKPPTYIKVGEGQKGTSKGERRKNSVVICRHLLEIVGKES